MNLKDIAWERVFILLAIMVAIIILIKKITMISLFDMAMVLLGLYLLFGLYCGIHRALRIAPSYSRIIPPSTVATAAVLSVVITILLWPRNVWRDFQDLNQNSKG
jgi:hypothetical protein